MILGRDNTVLVLTTLGKYCSLTVDVPFGFWRSFYSSSKSPLPWIQLELWISFSLAHWVVYLIFWVFLLKMYLGSVCIYGVKPFTTLSPLLYISILPWCLLFNIYLGFQKSVLVMGAKIQIQFLWSLVFSYKLFGNKTFKLVTVQTSQLIMNWERC